MKQTLFKDQWGGGNFTSREIDQLIGIAKQMANGACRIDGRTVSSGVRRWLKQWDYIERTDAGLELTRNLTGLRATDWLPLEALWRMVSHMLIDGHAGFSIARHKDWAWFNVYEYGHRLHTGRDMAVIERALDMLAVYGYIYFQAGGSVWCIAERKDRIVA